MLMRGRERETAFTVITQVTPVDSCPPPSCGFHSCLALTQCKHWLAGKQLKSVGTRVICCYSLKYWSLVAMCCVWCGNLNLRIAVHTYDTLWRAPLSLFLLVAHSLSLFFFAFYSSCIWSSRYQFPFPKMPATCLLQTSGILIPAESSVWYAGTEK